MHATKTVPFLALASCRTEFALKKKKKKTNVFMGMRAVGKGKSFVSSIVGISKAKNRIEH